MPPGSDERQIGIIPNGHTTYSEKNNLRYLRLIRKYSSIIQGQFFGHLHSDSFRIVYNDMGKAFPSIALSFFSNCFPLSFAFFLFSVSSFTFICSIRYNILNIYFSFVNLFNPERNCNFVSNLFFPFLLLK